MMNTSFSSTISHFQSDLPDQAFVRVGPICLIAVFMMYLFICCRPVGAQNVIGADGQPMFAVDERLLLQIVFQNVQSLADARKKAENHLEVQLGLIEQSSEISSEQREKLLLAGRGDIHRFFTEFNSVRASVKESHVPQNEWGKLHQKFQPLRTKFEGGLHGEKSLFKKIISSTLNNNQLTAWNQLKNDRDQRRYGALIQVTIAMIDDNLPLTVLQRTKLEESLSARNPSLENVGTGYDSIYFILVQLNEIPEKELKPLFDENEWKSIQQLRQQGASHKRRFQQRGQIQ